MGLAELERGAEAIRWWIKRGQPPPLLLSAEEIRDGSDAFPIEFLDIKENHRLLDGQDLAAGIQVSTEQHREQLEHELRSRLLRLRKRFPETQHDRKAVAHLMIAANVRHAVPPYAAALGLTGPHQETRDLSRRGRAFSSRDRAV